MNGPAINPALSLADDWQRNFPLEPAPFARLAAAGELSQFEVIELLQSLKDSGVLARIGAALRPNTVGASTLAAIAAPGSRLDEVAQIINRHHGVNHNYQRENTFNLWFVVTAGNRAEVVATIRRISEQTGLKVLDLPLQRAYHIDLGFRLSGGPAQQTPSGRAAADIRIEQADRDLLTALEDGLDLVPRPYARLGVRAGLSERDVIVRLAALIEGGVIARFGCILRHRALGLRANAMVVWDVPDREVDRLAGRLAGRDEVNLCYRRSRRLPDWRYNLYAMIHGRERATVTGQIIAAARATGLDGYASEILFSTRCYKQSGARLAPDLRRAS
jgi:DNA-binding Lrp family transcriptional regulator